MAVAKPDRLSPLPGLWSSIGTVTHGFAVGYHLSLLPQRNSEPISLPHRDSEPISLPQRNSEPISSCRTAIQNRSRPCCRSE